MTTQIVFTYPDPTVMEKCEDHAKVIRELGRGVANDVAEMGKRLQAVYTLLRQSRPVFLLWLDQRLGISENTAKNWIRWYEFTQKHPDAPIFASMTLSYQVASLPDCVQKQIIEKGVTTEAGIRPILIDHDCQTWTEQMEDYLENGIDGKPKSFEDRAGDVYHWASQALRDEPDLQQAAESLLEKHADLFARLSDRTTDEIMVESGMSKDRRMSNRPYTHEDPPPIRPYYRENLNGRKCPTCGSSTENRPFKYDQVEVKINGETYPVLIIRHDDDPIIRSWQRDLMRAVVDKAKIATVDDVGGQYL